MATEKGLITKGFGELFEVKLTSGEVIHCTIRGSVKHKNTIPLVGDNVIVQIQNSGKSVITDISERKNFLIRPPIANLDKLFIVCATTNPTPSFETIDKITCAATAKDIEPILVINKTDLYSSSEIKSIYEKSKIKIFEVCAKQNEGIDKLKEQISGICAFAGSSGVGKSSLMNALFPNLKLTVGSLSDKSGRGKHTTRTVELFEFDGGYFADTPGFALIDFEKFDFLTLKQLPESFPEFLPFLKNCKYTDCTHTKEGDDCGIYKAVIENQISKSRYENYLQFYYTLKNKKIY